MTIKNYSTFGSPQVLILGNNYFNLGLAGKRRGKRRHKPTQGIKKPILEGKKRGEKREEREKEKKNCILSDKINQERMREERKNSTFQLLMKGFVFFFNYSKFILLNINKRR